MNNNVLSTLGLCKRAGKTVTGFDAVVSEIRKASGIVIACDLSDKTKKEIFFHCSKNNKQIIEINHTMEEIQNIIGKRTGVIAITDQGLFKSLFSVCERDTKHALNQ